MTLSFQLFHVCQWQVVQVKADACPWQVIQGKAACPGGPSHDLCLSVTSCPRQERCYCQGYLSMASCRGYCRSHGCLPVATVKATCPSQGYLSDLSKVRCYFSM